jgi:23S rRNA (adenine2503-C2)-methyltransferase
LLHTFDGIPLETVLIPAKNRVTACISTQTGCVLDCSFCATAKINKFRNLTVAEIINQVFFIDKLARNNFGKHLTNVVIMGMGEAFLNYAETSKALNILTDTKYWAWSPSRITLSTAGIVPKIKAFALDHPKIQLAISLHAANDEKRSSIMPVNNKYNLTALREALSYYHKQTNNRITLEYLMLKEVNDSLQDAAELAEFCKAFPVKINLIRYNTVETSPFKASDEKSVEAFAEFLENKKNLIVTIRQSRGEDIAAACGQLANKS